MVRRCPSTGDQSFFRSNRSIRLAQLRAVVLTGGLSYLLVLTRELIGDALRLSGPHVSRAALQCLRAAAVEGPLRPQIGGNDQTPADTVR
jgi:hypothetical protein